MEKDAIGMWQVAKYMQMEKRCSRLSSMMYDIHDEIETYQQRYKGGCYGAPYCLHA